MAKFVEGLAEKKLGVDALDQEPAKGVVFGTAAPARRKREHVVRFAHRVEDQDRAYRRRFARCRGQPPARNRRQRGGVGHGQNDVVFFDDALVETVDLLVGE